MSLRVAFVCPELAISGGIHIVLRYAEELPKLGNYETFVLVPERPTSGSLPFLRGEETSFKLLSYQEAEGERFDVVFATWWETLAHLHRFRSRNYSFLCQALEAQFYEYGDRRQARYERYITSGISVVCIAGWLKSCLERSFGLAPEAVSVVLNALDAAQWKPVPPAVPKGNRPRFMIEGPLTDPRKNVRETIAILEEAGAEYLWVGSVVNRRLVGRGCVGVFEKVPYSRMPEFYSSCDVLLKLSNAEGMFGPPLEMFATGGTSIAWDVPGAEEYMRNEENSLLVPMNSLSRAKEAVLRLQGDPALLAKLKESALRTAQGWPDWEAQARAFATIIDKLPANDIHELNARVLRSLQERLAELETRPHKVLDWLLPKAQKLPFVSAAGEAAWKVANYFRKMT